MSINLTISNVIEFLEKCFSYSKRLNCEYTTTETIELNFDINYELEEVSVELEEVNCELTEICCELPEIDFALAA